MLLLRHLRGHCDPAVLMAGKGALAELLDSEGIAWHTLSRLDRGAVPGMVRLIRSGGYRLVYGNNSSGASRNALIAARLAGARFICHVREMGWGKTWRRWGFLRLTDAVITISEACAASTRRFVPAERLYVVHNGVELPPSRTDRAGERGVHDTRGDPAPGPVMIAVGHICERKGTLEAVDMMSRVVEKLPGARLLLVGALDREPEYVQRVRSLIREKNLYGTVELMGFRRDVERLLPGADILVHTAVSEPHGRSVIEAMAAGLPVAAFGVDGVAESVEDGVSGILVKKGDVPGLAEAVVRLGSDAPLRREMGAAGRTRVARRFSAAATAEGVLAVIDAVLAGRPRLTARAAAIPGHFFRMSQ